MTQELMERTIRDWVFSNPDRGARNLGRVAPSIKKEELRSPDQVADALIILAGRRQVASNRLW